METTNVNILVVDDDETIRRNIEKTLEQSEFIVHLANGYSQAVQIAEKHEFGAILLDIIMPDSDGTLSRSTGIDLLKLFKQKYPNIPIIMLSSLFDVDLATSLVTDFGAFRFLLKDAFPSGDTLVLHIKEALQAL